MNTGGVVEAVEVAKSHEPQLADKEKEMLAERIQREENLPEYQKAGSDGKLTEEQPTDIELHTLRRISGKVPWTAYTVALVELCERFSYYGTTAVCKLCLSVDCRE